MNTNIIRTYLHLLRCLKCNSSDGLILNNTVLQCTGCGKRYPIVEGIPIFLENIETDSGFTQKKWDVFYQENAENFSGSDEVLYSRDFQDVLKYLDPMWKDKTNGLYLEIGCGPAMIGLHMAKRGRTVVGVDASLKGLLLASG